MLGIVVVIAVFAACAGFCLLLCKIDTIVDKKRSDKRRKKYPELFELFDKINKKGIESCSYYNREVSPRVISINEILASKDYYTDETRAQKEVELKQLKEDLQKVRCESEKMTKELYELREEARTYVYRHKIKWAMKMGW